MNPQVMDSDLPNDANGDQSPCFPRTRYQGSKRKLAAAIVKHTKHLAFTSVLDAFGGTGAVAYAFKRAGKAVTYNDYLAFNHQIGLALIANNDQRISEGQLQWLLHRHAEVTYGDIVERVFDGVYFTREENSWLDMVAANIRRLADPHVRALAWYALFQAAMIKRPYNLFHRRNLYMRAADVSRTFGNKATWDKPFPDHFLAFAREGNRAVFFGGHPCHAIHGDALEAPCDFDLVYFDPPYMNARGQSVDYHHFYHFLEGLVDYDRWSERIDWQSKHRRLAPRSNSWQDRDAILDTFRSLFDRFSDSMWMVSYRSDGIPGFAELKQLMEETKRDCQIIQLSSNPYALSTNDQSSELLFVAHGEPFCASELDV